VRREPESAAAHRELATHALARASAAERAAGAAAARPHLVAAERHFARALALDPRDRESYGYYGCTLSGLGRGEEAAQALAQAGAGPWQACATPDPATAPAPP
jgi:Tfp pilus assembly protein PilF